MSISIRPDIEKKQNRITPELYSSFAEHLGRCIYSGIWVGEKSSIKNEGGFRIDVLEALKELEIPVLRWPGGCFADNYHWIDGIGPREERPRRNNIWWKQPENNAFGTDEFMRLCKYIGSEPYLAINVGSGSVQEAMDWLEYCNSKHNTEFANLRMKYGSLAPYNVVYWGVGNENWGCGGSMTPEYYADLYRQYACYLRQQAGDSIKLILCGSNPDLDDWDEIVLKKSSSFYFSLVDYISLHVYTGFGISQSEITLEKYHKIISDIDITKKKIERAIELSKLYSGNKKNIKVILDEWGLWYKEADVPNGLYQDGLFLDSIFAALNFHLFHQYSGDLFMTNMAQTVNVLQSFILTKGPAMVLTPTYYVYKMYKPHRDNYIVPTILESPEVLFSDGSRKPALSVSGSITDDGKNCFFTIVNIDTEKDYAVKFDDQFFEKYSVTDFEQLHSEKLDDKNTFSQEDKISPVKVDSLGKNDFIIKKQSVNSIYFRKK